MIDGCCFSLFSSSPLWIDDSDGCTYCISLLRDLLEGSYWKGVDGFEGWLSH